MSLYIYAMVDKVLSRAHVSTVSSM